MTQHVSVFVNEKFVKPEKPIAEEKNDDDDSFDYSIDSDLVYKNLDNANKKGLAEKISGGFAQKILKKFV